MKKVRIFFILAASSFLISFFQSSPIEAACVSGGYDIVDNDQLNSPSSNSYNGSWAYESAGNSYNGDHRYLSSPPSSSTSTYSWFLPSQCSKTARIAAYIWNTKFTNPAANYKAYSSGLYLIMDTTLNQRNAPGGWNYVGSTSSSSIYNVELSVSTSSTGATGADAIKFSYN